MVVEQNVGVEHDAREVQVLRQLGEEALAVVVAEEDRRAAVAAAGHVIQGVGKVDAWWAWHAGRIPSFVTNCKPNSAKYKPDPVRRRL